MTQTISQKKKRFPPGCWVQFIDAVGPQRLSSEQHAMRLEAGSYRCWTYTQRHGGANIRLENGVTIVNFRGRHSLYRFGDFDQPLFSTEAPEPDYGDVDSVWMNGRFWSVTGYTVRQIDQSAMFFCPDEKCSFSVDISSDHVAYRTDGVRRYVRRIVCNREVIRLNDNSSWVEMPAEHKPA